MKIERILVTLTIEERTYHKLWNTRRTLRIPAPFDLKISRTESGIVVETKDDAPFGKICSFNDDYPVRGFELWLRKGGGSHGHGQTLSIHLRPADELAPVWSSPAEVPFLERGNRYGEEPTFIFGCVGKAVRESGRLSESFVGTLAGQPVFRVMREKGGGYRLRALVAEVEVHTPARTLILDRHAEMGELRSEDLEQTTISFGACDWHFASAGNLWGDTHEIQKAG